MSRFAVASEDFLREATANRDISNLAYDSAERRHQRATNLERSGLDPDLVRVRVISDLDNATPAIAAVETSPKRYGRARSSAPGIGVQRERGGLSR